MSDEVKRCPFCGGEAFLWDEREFHDHKGWFAMCGDCDASGDTKPTQAEAIAAWNTRAEPEAAPVEPVAWKNYAPDGDWWLTDEREPADSCDYSVPLYTHPPAAPTDALVERLREALRTIRDHDGASYRYGDWVRETARAAIAAMQEAGE